MLMEVGQTITIQKLLIKLEEKIRLITNLNAVYIGKTQNIESAEHRHSIDYDKTIPIALGSPLTIANGEDYLITFLK